jgi:hypothetical protein
LPQFFALPCFLVHGVFLILFFIRLLLDIISRDVLVGNIYRLSRHSRRSPRVRRLIIAVVRANGTSIIFCSLTSSGLVSLFAAAENLMLRRVWQRRHGFLGQCLGSLSRRHPWALASNVQTLALVARTAHTLEPLVLAFRSRLRCFPGWRLFLLLLPTACSALCLFCLLLLQQSNSLLQALRLRRILIVLVLLCVLRFVAEASGFCCRSVLILSLLDFGIFLSAVRLVYRLLLSRRWNVGGAARRRRNEWLLDKARLRLVTLWLEWHDRCCRGLVEGCDAILESI